MGWAPGKAGHFRLFVTKYLVIIGRVCQWATCNNFFKRKVWRAVVQLYKDPKVPLLKFKSPPPAAVHKYFLPHSHAGQPVVFDIWLAGDLTVGNTTL